MLKPSTTTTIAVIHCCGAFPRGEHSQKPIEVLKAIERMFPTQDRIELFARHKPEGWDVWGLDVREE